MNFNFLWISPVNQINEASSLTSGQSFRSSPSYQFIPSSPLTPMTTFHPGHFIDYVFLLFSNPKCWSLAQYQSVASLQ